MCWKNLKFNCTVLFENKAITGTNLNDRRTLILLVANEFPEYSRLHVAFAIDKFIASNPQYPLSPNGFVTFLQGYLK